MDKMDFKNHLKNEKKIFLSGQQIENFLSINKVVLPPLPS